MGYAFISYSTKNQFLADSMRQLLRRNGIESWMAPADIPPGSKYAQIINRAIKDCSCVVLMLSDAAQSSSWVAKEIERAVHYHKVIIPVQLEDFVLNDEFEFYLSTDQIVAVMQFDENTPEIKKILASVHSICGNTKDMHFSEYSVEDIRYEPLPKNYSFYEMLGISQINDYSIFSKWMSSKVEKSLATPIGIAEDGKPLFLNIHNNVDSPVGLIAGSAGSGKSEFLQSYVLSMSLHYHPHEVAFIIIDLKGGGMASRFIGLPHLVGTVNSIYGQDIHVLLQSIEKELHRRHRVFAEYNNTHTDTVKDIDDYLERYKSGCAFSPLPHLIIIVDEFAELKVVHPELMYSLIRAAQIGRRLGIHLILSTQIPADQIDNHIERNVGFRICFKTACSADSTIVIGSNLASNIDVPGRAYLRIGNSEVLKLFQSGYSSQKMPSVRGTTIEQGEEILHYIKEYCELNKIEKSQDICFLSL